MRNGNNSYKSLVGMIWLLSCSMDAVPTTWGFTTLQIPSSTRAGIRLFQALSSNGDRKDNEPDLFDYFDPLLSPHAYPNGISPDIKPEATTPPFPKKASVANPFGIDYMSQKRNARAPTTADPSPSKAPTSISDDSGVDLLDYFDPLLSPHAYPNGIISPSTKPQQPQPLEEDQRYNPLKMKTISGPAAASSTPSRKKIGILLMDHGSRNTASNARLHRIAELYQLSIGDGMSTTGSSSTMMESEIIVKGAHMEIATPSIPDGLQALLEHGVDEIVCHPYFLSPGRHVTEDIPQIVSQAIADLSIKIPVITTDPVGSNVQLMIGAIHSLVRENSQVLREQNKNV